FLLVLLDVIPIRAAKDFPIEVPRVIPVCVFPMLGKLDRKTAVGRLMLAGHITLDDIPRVQPQRCSARNGYWVEQGINVLFFHTTQEWARKPMGVLRSGNRYIDW